MKRLLTIIAAGLLVLSCGNTERQQDDRLIEWTFNAPATKAQLGSRGTFSWNKGDQIAIWDATGGSFVTFTTPSGNGRFSAMAPASADFSGIAFYPASIASTVSSVDLPASYTVSGLEAGAGIPMYAIVEDGESLLQFKHLGALLSVNVKNVPKRFTYLTMSAEGVSLSGPFTLSDASGFKEIHPVAGSGSVGVVFSLSDSGDLNFTFPIPVGRYAISYVSGSESEPDLLQCATDEYTFERGHAYRLEASEAGIYGVINSIGIEPYGLEDYTDNWN